MNTQTNSNKKPLTPAQTAALIGALAPVKVSKAKTLPKPPKVVYVDMNDLPDTGVKPTLGLPKPNKKLKNGVFAGIAVELGRMITKPQAKPDKPTDEVREAVLNGLGVHGNPIKQVAKRCIGMTSAAVIWQAIDDHRAANNGVMPNAATIDSMRLSCIKRGELFESRVKLANIKCELWAYACYYQLGGKTNKSNIKKGN
jgi:hypothetical protein